MTEIDLATKESLDAFYSQEDPWDYESTPDDESRLGYLQSVLPTYEVKRTLDIGCGNGFVTCTLPGEKVIGCDISSAAIEWARKRAAARADSTRFEFYPAALLDTARVVPGPFDLVVITGVLYPQYIGRSFSVVTELVRTLLAPGGTLISCHIAEWYSGAFPFIRTETILYPYRQYTHRLEVYRR